MQKSRNGFIQTILFDNGYQLKPLCARCGKPAMVCNMNIRGSVLSGMEWDVGSKASPPALVLILANRVDDEEDPFEDVFTFPVHPASVYSIQ